MLDFMEDTVRLYKKADDGMAFVWVYGFEDGEIHLDTGGVGKMAIRKTIPLSNKPQMDTAVAQFVDSGFSPISENQMSFLTISFKSNGFFAKRSDLAKRNRLIDALDEFLALTGQGWVDGADSGGGMMSVIYTCVDAEISKLALTEWIKDTEWADYASIQELAFD